MAFDDRTGSLGSALRVFNDAMTERAKKIMVGVITKYDATKQRASVQLVQRAYTKDADGNVTTEAYPELSNVPVAFPRMGGMIVIGPVKADDTCLVFFSDRSLDAWQTSGQGKASDSGIEDPIQRYNDITDAIAYVGIWPDAKAVTVGQPDALVMGSEAQATGRIYCRDGGISMGDPAPASFIALANGVLARLNAIENYILTHTHIDALGGTGVPTVPITPLSVLSDVASTTTKAK